MTIAINQQNAEAAIKIASEMYRQQPRTITIRPARHLDLDVHRVEVVVADKETNKTLAEIGKLDKEYGCFGRFEY